MTAYVTGQYRVVLFDRVGVSLRTLTAETLAAAMDHYAGLSGWSQHGWELAGAAHLARGWAAAIDAACQSEP